MHIPPPSLDAELPLKVQLVNVGLLEELTIPPPKVVELPLKVQLVMVELLEE